MKNPFKPVERPYLSQESIAMLDGWFRDRDFDLVPSSGTPEIKEYLAQIQEVVVRTGATNLDLAEYLLTTERRILHLESIVDLMLLEDLGIDADEN